MPRAVFAAVLLVAFGIALGAERRLTLEPGAKSVRRFDKIEFTITTDANFQNPYDPAEADLRLELKSPSGKELSIPAFHFQPFERRPIQQGGRTGEWLYPVGSAHWKARFAPSEIGTWRCAAALHGRSGVARSATVEFQCTEGSGHGSIRVSEKNPRYLEFGDGTPFFAVGQNVAFVTDSYRSIDMIRKLGENGGNFARVWACSEDWAMAIEARKSAFGRSWDWRPPLVPMPDREAYHEGRLCIRLAGEAGANVTLNPCDAVALRPGTRYRVAGKIRGDDGTGISFQLNGEHQVAAKKQWTAFAEEFTSGASQWWLGQLSLRLTGKGNVLLRDLSLKEAGGGPELLWEADPNRPPVGVYNQPDCFMLDQLVLAAEEAGVYLQVVLLTRDHYMHNLAREGRGYDQAIEYASALARYASARWGYSTHISAWEYFNEMNPGLPTGRFYTEVGAAFQKWDVNHHLRATSGWASPTKEYSHPSLETADMHFYLRPAEKELYKDEVAAVLARAKLLNLTKDRPLMFAEFGITDDKWQRSALLDKDAAFTHYHNAMWAAALAGFASTPCHWYWDDIQRRNLYSIYRPLAQFTADIPFTTTLRPARAKAEPALRVIGLQSERGAYLWINDPQSTWWKVAVEGVKPGQIGDTTLEIDGLSDGTYRAQWWDTRAGKPIKEETLEVKSASPRLKVPAFTGDIAVKLIKS